MTKQDPKITARKKLINALRYLPTGFEWKFQSYYSIYECGTAGCACGVAKEIGLVGNLFPRFGELPPVIVGDAIGLNPDDAWRIFCPWDERGNYIKEQYNVPAHEVTPAMVADALEQTLNDQY